MKYCAIVIFILLAFVSQAQATQDVDFLRSTGKIYVVAIVCLMILLAFFGYLIRLDRKVSKLEKRQQK